MKSSLSHRAGFRRLVVTATLALLATAPAYAGMGLQYWQNKKQAPENRASSRAPAHCAGCAADRAATTMTTAAWPNGRGPLVSTAQEPSDSVHTCKPGGIVRRPTWHNGRGPLQPVVVSEPSRATVAQR